ncbi:hypothetical protein SMICM17S_03407 [Streptomyces microflavus]
MSWLPRSRWPRSRESGTYTAEVARTVPPPSVGGVAAAERRAPLAADDAAAPPCSGRSGAAGVVGSWQPGKSASGPGP